MSPFTSDDDFGRGVVPLIAGVNGDSVVVLPMVRDAVDAGCIVRPAAWTAEAVCIGGSDSSDWAPGVARAVTAT
jgi:hypothetical protein